MQLAFDLEPPPWANDPHPDLERLRSLNLGTAVFYYCARELAAGRPCPTRPKLTDEQRAYVDWWIDPTRLRPAR